MTQAAARDQAVEAAPVFVGAAGAAECLIRRVLAGPKFFSSHLPGGPDELAEALSAPQCSRRRVWISTASLFQIERVLSALPGARFVMVTGCEDASFVRALGRRFPHAFLELDETELGTAAGLAKLQAFVG